MYCTEIKIKKDIGNLTFINAHKPSTLMNEIISKGLDIDNGMVLKVDESIYYGREAIHILTLLSTPIGLFSKKIILFFDLRFYQ
ncbi:hypothetical protein [Candidatus Jidaibacter acanthamoebae]|nr:hypothetical protein [Candidatus Jidaibacter acanthamoeba]